MNSGFTSDQLGSLEQSQIKVMLEKLEREEEEDQHKKISKMDSVAARVLKSSTLKEPPVSVSELKSLTSYFLSSMTSTSYNENMEVEPEGLEPIAEAEEIPSPEKGSPNLSSKRICMSGQFGSLRKDKTPQSQAVEKKEGESSDDTASNPGGGRDKTSEKKRNRGIKSWFEKPMEPEMELKMKPSTVNKIKSPGLEHF